MILEKLNNTKRLPALSLSCVGAVTFDIRTESEAQGCFGTEECTTSRSFLRMMEDNLEELGNKFLYQEFPVHGPEAL